MTILFLPLAFDFCLFFADAIESLLSRIFFLGGNPRLFDPDIDERVDFYNIDLMGNFDQIDSLFKEKHFDIVYHLAAITDMQLVRENPERVFDVNVVGTINLLNALSSLRIL